jgi:hypothetical protein
VNETRQDANPAVPVAASRQLLGPTTAPVVGEDVKRTDPVGVVLPVDAVSATIAVHVVAPPSVSDEGEHDTLVEVGSTEGAGEDAVIENDRPLLVL